MRGLLFLLMALLNLGKVSAQVCDVEQFGQSPKGRLYSVRPYQGAAVEELQRVVRGAIVIQAAFLAGTATTLAIDFDRREVIRVDTYVGDGVVGRMRAPTVAPAGASLRKSRQGDAEITYVVRSRGLTIAEVQAVACPLNYFWEWQHPAGWTPPMPALDGVHEVLLISDSRVRNFRYSGEPVAITTAIVQQAADPRWRP